MKRSKNGLDIEVLATGLGAKHINERPDSIIYGQHINEREDSITHGYSAITAGSGKELLRRYGALISKKYGITIGNTPKILGQGTRGTAYDVGGGKVLKLTDDDTEAQAAAKLKDHPVEFAVHVFAVFEIRGYYGIVQEKLSPLPASVKTSIDYAFKGIAQPDDFREFIKNGGTVDQFLAHIDSVEKELQDQGEFKELTKLKSARGVLEKYGIFDIVKELGKMGIQFHDLHTGSTDNNEGNLMMRNGKLVVLDLGNSVIAGAGKIDSLSEMINRASAWILERRAMLLKKW